MGKTPICSISATGIFKPTWGSCLQYFTDAYRGIYGNDVIVDDPATMDVQFLNLLASALDDTNVLAVNCYNAFSPTTAQGTGLSSVVKIDGIARNVPSYSSCAVLVTGTVGLIITRGIVLDDSDIQWALPDIVVIPPGGSLLTTATCTILGAVAAYAGEITRIFTPVYGWDTVINLVDAALGAPLETDAALRQRQTFSASLPSIGPTQALAAGIAAVPNVTRFRIYENPQPATDSWGIPGHHIAVVVGGGDATTVANVIALKKSEGVGTYGVLAITLPANVTGIVKKIWYSFPKEIRITYSLSIITLPGFTQDIQNQICTALADWTTSLGIGAILELADAYMAARLFGGPDSSTFRIVPDTLLVARDGAATAAVDLPMAYNEAPICVPGYVNITLIPTR